MKNSASSITARPETRLGECTSAVKQLKVSLKTVTRILVRWIMPMMLQTAAMIASMAAASQRPAHRRNRKL
jgi:hypothetical protein